VDTNFTMLPAIPLGIAGSIVMFVSPLYLMLI